MPSGGKKKGGKKKGGRKKADIIHSDLERRRAGWGAPIPGPKKKGASRHAHQRALRTSEGKLLQAVTVGDRLEVEQLLKAGVPAKSVSRGTPAIYQASRGGWTDIIKLLLSHGADIEAREVRGEKLGMTPLIEALGHLDPVVLHRTVEVLLFHGAEINAKSYVGTPLIYACRNRNVTRVIIELLLSHGADIHEDGTQAMREACVMGNTSVVEVLLSHGVDINSKIEGQYQPVLFAAMGRFDTMESKTSLVKQLISHGADINIKDSSGKTAVLEAERRGLTDVVSLLKNPEAILQLRKKGQELEAKAKKKKEEWEKRKREKEKKEASHQESLLKQSQEPPRTWSVEVVQFWFRRTLRVLSIDCDAESVIRQVRRLQSCRGCNTFLSDCHCCCHVRTCVVSIAALLNLILACMLLVRFSSLSSACQRQSERKVSAERKSIY